MPPSIGGELSPLSAAGAQSAGATEATSAPAMLNGRARAPPAAPSPPAEHAAPPSTVLRDAPDTCADFEVTAATAATPRSEMLRAASLAAATAASEAEAAADAAADAARWDPGAWVASAAKILLAYGAPVPPPPEPAA
jgi:hypothetical protein